MSGGRELKTAPGKSWADVEVHVDSTGGGVVSESSDQRVVVTISSGTYANRCALAQIFHQVLDNFDIANERSEGLIPYSELEMLDSNTSVKICVETE